MASDIQTSTSVLRKNVPHWKWFHGIRKFIQEQSRMQSKWEKVFKHGFPGSHLKQLCKYQAVGSLEDTWIKTLPSLMLKPLQLRILKVKPQPQFFEGEKKCKEQVTRHMALKIILSSIISDSPSDSHWKPVQILLNRKLMDGGSSCHVAREAQKHSLDIPDVR